MRRTVCRLLFVTACLGLFCGSDWLQFRGTDNQSVSDQKGLPTTFSDGQNVAWKVPLPGPGPSGPIVVAGRVVVTCASGPRQDRLHVLVVDAKSGKLMWQRQLWATGSVIHNPFGGIAAPTPASDGQRIFVFYSSNDLACFDLEGNLQWLRGLGLEHPRARNDVGMASSPLVVGDTVVVQLENQGDSFAEGLNAQTGETRWQLPLELDSAWNSPLVLRAKTPQEDLVLLQCRARLLFLEPRTGKQVAVYDHWTDTVASATACGDVVYLPADGLRALRLNRQTKQVDLLWQSQRLRTSNASPVVCDGRVYVMKSPGIVVCGDAAKGDVLWQLRMTGPIWATPVVADGHLYAVNHAGLVQCAQLGAKGQLAGTGQVDGGVLGSPAVAEGAVFVRTGSHLWKIAKTASK